MPVVRPKSLFRFGVFEFDSQTGDLWKAGRRRRRLQDQQRELLSLLIEHPGELVPRDTIQRRLWPDGTFVDAETGLNVIVNRVRQALGDVAASPRFIETLPRKGYRFIAPVQSSDQVVVEAAPQHDPLPVDESRAHAPLQPGATGKVTWRSRRFWFAGALGLVVAIVILMVHEATSQVARPGFEGTAFAVMPLTNLLGDSGSDYMVDGLTDSLITDLAAASGLHVIARQSVMRYRGREQDIPGVARELGVYRLVEGSVVHHDSGYAVNVQLVDGRTSRTLWAGQFERATWNALGASDDIALALAGVMGRPMSQETAARLRLKNAVSPEARTAYLRGRFYLNKRKIRDAENYFRAAIRIEPRYAAAWTGLAMLFATGEPGSLSPADIESGERAADEALRLDPASGEARAALGRIRLRQWRWAEAEREARRAVDMSPDDGTAHQWLGTLLMRTGRCDEALEQEQEAVRDDPLAPIAFEALGFIYLVCGRPALAIEPMRLAVSMFPDISRARRSLGSMLATTGAFDAAIPELREAIRLDPTDCLNQASLAHALAVGGSVDQARAVVANLKRTHDASPAAPYCLAIGYASVNDLDHAFESLDQAYAERLSLLDRLLIEWRLGRCRKDPRYKELLKKIGLLSYASTEEVVTRGPSFSSVIARNKPSERD